MRSVPSASADGATPGVEPDGSSSEAQTFANADGPDLSGELTFQDFISELSNFYSEYTPEFAEKESGVPAATIVDVARQIGRAGTRFSCHNWRSAGAGNLGGWGGGKTPMCLWGEKPCWVGSGPHLNFGTRFDVDRRNMERMLTSEGQLYMAKFVQRVMRLGALDEGMFVIEPRSSE